MIFEFNDVALGVGFAKLSMSIGRGHNLSKTPLILVNGEMVKVPSNWKGYDQANRKKFFGAIDIPIPMDFIMKNNTVKISFPDDWWAFKFSHFRFRNNYKLALY